MVKRLSVVEGWNATSGETGRVFHDNRRARDGTVRREIDLTLLGSPAEQRPPVRARSEDGNVFDDADISYLLEKVVCISYYFLGWASLEMAVPGTPAAIGWPSSLSLFAVGYTPNQIYTAHPGLSLAPAACVLIGVFHLNLDWLKLIPCEHQ